MPSRIRIDACFCTVQHVCCRRERSTTPVPAPLSTALRNPSSPTKVTRWVNLDVLSLHQWCRDVVAEQRRRTSESTYVDVDKVDLLTTHLETAMALLGQGARNS
eukprot:1159646-Pelagomonas_calceolata.AAC.2